MSKALSALINTIAINILSTQFSFHCLSRFFIWFSITRYYSNALSPILPGSLLGSGVVIIHYDKINDNSISNSCIIMVIISVLIIVIIITLKLVLVITISEVIVVIVLPQTCTSNSVQNLLRGLDELILLGYKYNAKLAINRDPWPSWNSSTLKSPKVRKNTHHRRYTAGCRRAKRRNEARPEYIVDGSCTNLDLQNAWRMVVQDYLHPQCWRLVVGCRTYWEGHGVL